jgi:thiol-disulfide isomerase/thioredoxin
MKFLRAVIFAVVSQIAFAGITENQINIQTENNQITLIPKKGFHINDKAPASATYDNLEAIYHPKIKTEQKLMYMVLSKIQKANLKFFVCDDAKTVCEQHEKSVDMSNGIIAAERRLINAPADLKKYVDATKPTLLIFSAPWCPACIRMKTETYTKKSVEKLFTKLNVQKINIDLIENEKISDQFHVKAIPTLVLLNTKGEEIYRWLDYQPSEFFAKELATESKNSESIDQTKSEADAGDLKAAKKLAKIYSGQMDWTNAVKYFGMLKDQDSINQKLNAEVSALSDDKDKDEKTKAEYLANLEKSIALTSSKIDQLRWTLDFFETKDTKKEDLDKVSVQKIIADANEILKSKSIAKTYSESTVGDMTGFENIETLDMRSRAEVLLGQNELKKMSQAEIVKLILAKKHDVNFPGQMINSIGYLTQAGATAESEKLILKLVEKYPKTYVYHQRYANFLTKQKRPAEALKQIDQALEYKEGNEPQLKVTKIKILKALDKKSEALLLTEETLKLIEIAPEKYKRTKVTLLDFQKELTKK